MKWHDLKLFDEESREIANEKWIYEKSDFSGLMFLPDSYYSFMHLKIIKLLSYMIFYFHPLTIFRHLKIFNNIYDVKRYVNGARALLIMIIKTPFEKSK